MHKTSVALIDALVFINAFISLLPAVLVFIQRKYFKEPLFLLMILCVLNAGKYIFLLQSQSGNQNTLENIFSIIELIIILRIFASSCHSKLKKLIPVLLAIFIAYTIAFYFINVPHEKRISVEIIQTIVIAVVASVSLFYLVERNSLSIFSYPIFWIAAGTLFYVLISVLIKMLDGDSDAGRDGAIILNMASIIRYVFFMLGVLFYKPNNDSDESSFR
jgi:hypothetical protein